MESWQAHCAGLKHFEDGRIKFACPLNPDHIVVGRPLGRTYQLLCLGDCPTDRVLSALELTQSDLTIDPQPQERPAEAPKRPAAAFSTNGTGQTSDREEPTPDSNGKPHPPHLQIWMFLLARAARLMLEHDAGQSPELVASFSPEILFDGVMKNLRRGVDAGHFDPLPELNLTELEEHVEFVAREVVKDFRAAHTRKVEEEQPLVPARARTLKEYREGYKELLDQQWPLEDTLCPGCVSLLTAKKGIGKSTLFRYFIVNALRGDPSLGRASAPDLRVLYLPLEAGGMPVLLGFEKAGLDDHANFRIEDNIPAEYRTLEQRALWVKQLIQEHQPHLVIIDTLGRFSRLGGNDDYGGTTEIVGELEKIARETNCHIIYSHHVGKNRSDDADLSGAALGSSGIESAAQAHIHLRRRAKGLVTIEIGDMRVGKALPETVLSWNEPDDSLQLGDLWSNTNLQMLESTKTMVQSFLLSAPPDEWYSANTAAKELNIGRRWVSWALRILFEGSQLDRNGKGRRGSPYEFRKGTGIDHEKQDQQKT